jgi:hypothetical protein
MREESPASTLGPLGSHKCIFIALVLGLSGLYHCCNFRTGHFFAKKSNQTDRDE